MDSPDRPPDATARGAPPGGGRWRPRLAWVGDALALAALLWPAWTILDRARGLGVACATMSNPLDIRLVGYLLEWGYRFVTGRAAGAPLWSPPFFYPEANVLAYSDTYFAAYPFYVPLRLAGLEPAAALFWLHLAQWALTPLVTYFCLRALSLSRWAAFAGAYAYAWGWVRYFHFAHIQFSAGYLPPLFLTALALALARRRPWHLALAAWSFVLCWYFSNYLAIFALLAAALALALAWLLPGGRAVAARVASEYLAFIRRRPRRAAAVLALCLLAVVAVLASAGKYLEAQRAVGPPGVEEIRTYWGGFFSWLRPHAGNLLFGRLDPYFPRETLAPWEKFSYFGWLALAAMVVPVMALALRGRRVFALWPRAVVAASVAGLALVLVFTHWGHPWLELPFWTVRKLFPGFEGIRVPSRISMLVAVLAAFAAAAAVDLVRRVRWAGPLLAALLGVGLVAENRTPPPRLFDRCPDELAWEETERRLCPAVDRDAVGALLFLPMRGDHAGRAAQQTLAMHLGLACGLPVVNGYSGREPPGYPPLWRLDAFPCQEVRWIADRVRAASGRGLLVAVDRGGPAGPPDYPPEHAGQCLAHCLDAGAAAPPESPNRPMLVLATSEEGACVVP